ncbi:3-hydroxybutyrate dehydrogenase [Acidiphilium sp. AL]|uniref:3-hydroxybutyrate dehydrogenase n=1 Tax=Acidiphilium sp. AL TaxID=2871704 RepID=UPI0021CB6726|nr:3-hydroxybutyrate dehydrogenase [Acidiphilium sp. AL]MCU4160383.1 3-hydroxybutyrate dehydrogenase [Acidiphilium sp. AL]
MRLKNKSAIVTGAGAGIGKKIAVVFAREGANVCVADVDMSGAETTAREIRLDGGIAIAQRMDVTNEVQVNEVTDRVAIEFEGIDILVSNAGTQHLDTIADLTFENWKRVLAVHLDGAFLTTKACLRHIRARKRGGSIILMGSVHSYMSSVQKGPYVVAKHGLIGLCRTLAKEGASYGLRANAICPGVVRTGLIERQIPALARERGVPEEQALEEVFLQHTVDGEFTTESELAEVAVFLASFPTNALTGQSVCVSHGMFML